MARKKKILFVAYQFLPLSVGGSYRPFHLACQLSKSSEEFVPIVMRLDPADYDKVYSTYNLNRKAEAEALKLGIKVYDIPSQEILPKNRWQTFSSIYFNLFKGNEAKGWKSDFQERFNDIVRKENIDLVWVTAPPFGILELVRKACKGVDLPYVADLRDNWSLWLSTPHSSRIHYYLNHFLEKRIYRDAEAIIGVSPQQLNDLRSIYPKNEEKFLWIPNAFDGSLPKKHSYTKAKDELNIAYAGAFYFDPEVHRLLNTKWYRRKWHRKFFFWPRYERWIYRSPFFLFKCLAKLKKMAPQIKINFELAGNYEDWIDEMIKDFSLENEVKVHPYLDKDELQAMYNRADYLLITSVKVEGGEDYCIASKGFDYLKEKKKMIGLVSPGAQKEFLEKSANHIVLDPDNVEEACNELIKIAQFEEEKLIYYHEYLESFRIEETARKLERLFQSLLTKH